MNFNYNQDFIHIDSLIMFLTYSMYKYVHLLIVCPPRPHATSIVIMYMISCGDRTFRARERERER